MRILLPLILMFCLSINGYSQRRIEINQNKQSIFDEKTGLPEAILIVNSDNIKQMIVIDIEGKWIHDARNIQMNFTVGENPTIRCKIYKGLFEPSNPETKDWVLKGIVSASMDDFRVIVDDLQDGRYDKGK